MSAWVYAYEFDLRETNNLNVKEFVSAGREWAVFTAKNRLSRKRQHDYDMVIGKTANNDTRTARHHLFRRRLRRPGK
ncbi:MAG: DUF3990 domain-containing protein [Clostridiales bacterium]|nr:DUF3990 domain-containing protein [Clostridiales bacterium]